MSSALATSIPALNFKNAFELCLLSSPLRQFSLLLHFLTRDLVTFVTGLEVLDREFDLLKTMAEDEVETGSQHVGVMASGDKTTIYDVIIVGAGLAGT